MAQNFADHLCMPFPSLLRCCFTTLQAPSPPLLWCMYPVQQSPDSLCVLYRSPVPILSTRASFYIVPLNQYLFPTQTRKLTLLLLLRQKAPQLAPPPLIYPPYISIPSASESLPTLAFVITTLSPRFKPRTKHILAYTVLFGPFLPFFRT